jgi:CRP/FNR family transcriptional regulator, cyclic AMP receptor protein
VTSQPTRPPQAAIGTPAGVRLFEIEPDIGQFLSPEERWEARGLVLPTRVIPRGSADLASLLDEREAFGAFVFDGMLLQRMGVGDQVGLRLLGPGDLISLTKHPRSMVLSHADCRVVAPVHIALLGRQMSSAIQRWPGLLTGLQVRTSEQQDRLAAQIVICQLPRVDDRLLAMMWLLAESWGQVTPSGTTLPLHLTHDVLGGLVGARRSTVTLALGDLAARGALIRQDRGWLLPELPAWLTGTLKAPGTQGAIEYHVASSREQRAAPSVLRADVNRELIDTVKRLREQHVQNQAQVRATLAACARAREHRAQVRTLRRQTLTRRSAPS